MSRRRSRALIVDAAMTARSAPIGANRAASGQDQFLIGPDGLAIRMDRWRMDIRAGLPDIRCVMIGVRRAVMEVRWRPGQVRRAAMDLRRRTGDARR